MGKAVGAFVRFVFAVIILALLGYNTFETWRLRQEVNALKQARGVAPGSGVRESAPGGGGGTPLDRLGEARAHTERAKALLRERRFAEAQRELARATQAVRDAGGDARSQSAAAVESLRATVERLSAQADSLMGSEDTGRKAGTPGGSRANDQQKERTGR